MAVRDLLMAELGRALNEGSEANGARILSNITNLLLSATSYDQEQIRLYDEVIGRLITRIGTLALVELSEQIAPINYAPPNVIRALAVNDDIRVAGPVLTQSPCLTDDTLVTIANEKSQAHLLAISRRERLSDPVTDVLAAKGNPTVAQQVIANPGAQFSENGFNVLAKRAERHESLAVGIVARPDLPLCVFSRLLACASDEVKRRLLAATRQQSQDLISDVVTRAAGMIADEASHYRDYSAALRNVILGHPSGKLTEADVVYFAERGELEEMVAALSVIWCVPIELADQLVLRGRVNSLLFCSKAADFEWPTVAAILRKRPLEPTPRRPTELEYAALSARMAGEVLSVWQSGQIGTFVANTDRSVPT
jgi:uncharacterized protein (DUF2336 family)